MIHGLYQHGMKVNVCFWSKMMMLYSLMKMVRKAVCQRKFVRDAAPKLNDNDFIIDGILKDNEFFVMDIISYDGSDTSDMNTNERLKVLRGQLESHEGISIPGPFNTRVTDEEGLESAIDELKEEGRVLLRDAQSTYMKGEKRHPKWLILREGKTLNFIILDK